MNVSEPKEVRLIDASGENIGVVSIKEAMAKAYEADLDLVEVAPNAKPPGLPCHRLRQVYLRADKERKRGQEGAKESGDQRDPHAPQDH